MVLHKLFNLHVEILARAFEFEDELYWITQMIIKCIV